MFSEDGGAGSNTLTCLTRVSFFLGQCTITSVAKSRCSHRPRNNLNLSRTEMRSALGSIMHAAGVELDIEGIFEWFSRIFGEAGLEK